MNNPAENNKVFLQLLDVLHDAIISGEPAGLPPEISPESMALICGKADENRVGQLLYFYYGRLDVLPDCWGKKWADHFRAISATELRRANELEKIYEILATHQIGCAPLKGVYLAYYGYPHPALRTMSDIDLLIRPDEVERAFQVMLEHKFICHSAGNRSLHHMPPLQSPQGFEVELHSHILSGNAFRCTHDMLWGNSRQASFRGKPITLLAPEMHLLHAVNHAFRHNLVAGIKTFVDVAYLFKNGNIDFETLKECSVKAGFFNELSLFLNIFPDFFPKSEMFRSAEIPAGLMDDARYLIFHYKSIQQVDRHYLMLQRNYACLNGWEKLLFLKKCVQKKTSSLVPERQCREHSFLPICRYIRWILAGLGKFLLFEAGKNPQREFSRRVGTCQQRINCYRNGNLK